MEIYHHILNFPKFSLNLNKIILKMRFPLKLALSAVLAKTIAADPAHMEQKQQIPNEMDIQFQNQRSYAQPDVSFCGFLQNIEKRCSTFKETNIFQMHSSANNVIMCG